MSTHWKKKEVMLKQNKCPGGEKKNDCPKMRRYYAKSCTNKTKQPKTRQQYVGEGRTTDSSRTAVRKKNEGDSKK